MPTIAVEGMMMSAETNASSGFIYVPVPIERYNEVLRFLSASHKQRRSQAFRVTNNSDGRGEASDSDTADWRAPRSNRKSIPKSQMFEKPNRLISREAAFQEEISDLKHQLNIAMKSKQVSDSKNRQLKSEVTEARKHQAAANRSAQPAIQSVKREIVMTETKSLAVPTESSSKIEPAWLNSFDTPVVQSPPAVQGREVQALPAPESVSEVEKAPVNYLDNFKKARVNEAELVRRAIRKHGYKKVFSKSYLDKVMKSGNLYAGNYTVGFGVNMRVMSSVTPGEVWAIHFKTLNPTWGNLEWALEQFIRNPLRFENDECGGKPLPQ